MGREDHFTNFRFRFLKHANSKCISNGFPSLDSIVQKFRKGYFEFWFSRGFLFFPNYLFYLFHQNQQFELTSIFSSLNPFPSLLPWQQTTGNSFNAATQVLCNKTTPIFLYRTEIQNRLFRILVFSRGFFFPNYLFYLLHQNQRFQLTPIFSSFNPFPSLPSVAMDGRKQFHSNNKVRRNKTTPTIFGLPLTKSIF